VIEEFLAKTKDVSPQVLEYVPFMRYVVAGYLNDLAGKSLAQSINDILNDRETGGYTIGLKGITESTDDYVIFGTAISHLVGVTNFDAMSGTFYARFLVKDTDNSDSYLRQAYRNMTLHTDGTFVSEPTDWLLMMKMQEENAVGGESRLLHLDDWEELDKFYNHPLANHEFLYKSPPSKNVSETVNRKTFFTVNNKPCICFIDQFAYPDTIEQANYLRDLSESMENSPATFALSLPIGDLVMLNNTFWLHGRAAFEKHPELHRELMRQRGYFSRVQ
jgi:protein CsiD